MSNIDYESYTLLNAAKVDSAKKQVISRSGDIHDIVQQADYEKSEFKHRLIGYSPKTLQFVRDLESFEEYHKNNPGSLEHILAQTLAFSFFKEDRLKQVVRYGKGMKANTNYAQPAIFATIPILMSNGHTKDNRAYLLMPLSVIIEKSVSWLQGLVINAYGPEEGFKIIANAKQKAAAQFMLN